MSREYTVEKVALHLVRKEGFILAEKEISLDDFRDAGDAEAIHRFFSGHLEHIWNAAEGARTCAAKFTDNSNVRRYYQGLVEKSSDFFSHSCEMAKLLHKVSRGTRASSGLLLMLWVRASGDQRPFMSLLKMDPGRSDKIALRQGNGGLLLNLAVEHIEQALPEPGNQVLKWAVTPHPTRPAFDVKVKDQEGRSELARYFMEFLGCNAGLSEKKQIQALFKILPSYAQQYHPGVDVKTAIPQVLGALEQELTITSDVVVEKIKSSEAFTGFEEKTFRECLDGADMNNLYISSNTWRATKLQYTLPSGIVIKGPRAVMESLVTIRKTGTGETEFIIRTPSYQKGYVE